MNWNFFQFFQDDAGAYSNTRLMNFIIPATILFNQTWLIITKGVWQSLDPVSATVIFFALGIKYAQKRIEKPVLKPEKKELIG